jgi:glycine cleavage system H protein
VPDLSAYRFTATHEWVLRDNGRATVGISEFAASQLGDVIFVELLPPGTVLEPGAKLGSIESVKAASDLYAPVAGTVVETNTALTEKPELVNSDPYGDGWMIKLESVRDGGVELLDEQAYSAISGG